MKLIKTWRWFGENDPIQLQWLKEMGIEEVVTALHHIPNGKIWPEDEILKRKRKIEIEGLKWTVVESLPVSEQIKTGASLRQKHIEHYKISIKNLAAQGIKTVVYNFMPVIDWVRTDLNYKLPQGGESMLFDYPAFAAFDMFILKRPGAKNDYSPAVKAKAEEVFGKMSEAEAEKLAHTIIVVTQGFIDGLVDASVQDYKATFLKHLEKYKNIGREKLRMNLAFFLDQVLPVAEESGIQLAIHPDDPPFPVLGLPRIFSTLEDMEWLEKTNSSPSNGIAFCAGSFSARQDNDVVKMAKKFSHRIKFAHLRNTQFQKHGSFYESGHSEGVVNMPELIKVLLDEINKRKKSGRTVFRIPIRPDHGIKIINDFNLKGNPGYPFLGRLKGLAEITGMEQAILNMV